MKRANSGCSFIVNRSRLGVLKAFLNEKGGFIILFFAAQFQFERLLRVNFHLLHRPDMLKDRRIPGGYKLRATLPSGGAPELNREYWLNKKPGRDQSNIHPRFRVPETELVYLLQLSRQTAVNYFFDDGLMVVYASSRAALRPALEKAFDRILKSEDFGHYHDLCFRRQHCEQMALNITRDLETGESLKKNSPKIIKIILKGSHSGEHTDRDAEQ